MPEGAGGIRELRIPGVHVREALRPPVLAERALAGRDLDGTGLTYLFERTAGDDPFRRDPRRGSAGAVLVRDRQDGERGLERVIAPPAARAWRADGWGTVDARRRTARSTRWRARAAATFESSGRFEGRRASALERVRRLAAALDRVVARRAHRVAGVDRARSRPPCASCASSRRARRCVGRPWCGWSATMPRRRRWRSPRTAAWSSREPLRGRTFRLEILRAAFPAGASGVARQRRAVGIREITGAGVPIARVPRRGRVRSRCGDLAGHARPARVRLRADATIADLDAGRPLRLRSCGAAADLPAGEARLSMPPGTLSPYLLRLRSPAPDPPATAAAVPGRVLDSGTAERDARTGVRLECASPPGSCSASPTATRWRASCDGRDLGAPVPVDGFAMGWRVPARLRAREMAFAPDSLVRAGYLVSLPFLLAMLGLVIVRRAARAGAAASTSSRSRRPSACRARAGARRSRSSRARVLGFVFAARAAPLIAAGTFLILWRGVGVRGLVARRGRAAAVAVPVLTLAIGVEDRGGYNPEYAQVRIAVHWVTAAAVILLVLALARVLGAARRPRSPA